MPDERTNLLPEERRRALRRDYFLRLGVVSIVFLTLLTAVAAILLLPTYVFLTESAHTKEARLAGIESTLSSSDQAALSAQLAALSDDAATLEALASAPSVSTTVRNVLAISHPGITLFNFAYAPPTSKSPSIFAISGMAATRDALRSYQVALQGAPFALSADLPVSAYAKDTDIPFTITMTLTP